MTLAGEGVGIWDGDWDKWFNKEEIKEIQKSLKSELQEYVDDTGGGRIPNGIRYEIYLQNLVEYLECEA
jgi:hypothetical protein